MTWGALVGVSVGGAIGWALSDPGTDVQITNVVLFAGLGSLVGTFTGSYIKHEDWETVPLGRLPVALTSDSSDGIALSITIGP